MSTSTATRTRDLPPAQVTRHPSARRAATLQLASAGRRWVVGAVLLVLAWTGIGVAAGSQVPIRYTSEVRLSVGQNSLETLSVPGYVTATQQLASIYARYANTGSLGLDRLTAQLGLESGSLVMATASPIAGSNIVRIQVEGTSSAASTQAAKALGDGLVTQVNAPPDDRTQQREAMLQTSRQSAQAQQAVSDAEAALSAALDLYSRQNPGPRSGLVPPTSPEITAAKDALAAARSTYSFQQIATQEAAEDYRNAAPSDLENVRLEVVQPAGVVEDTRARDIQWGGVAGLAVGLLTGFLLLVVAARRARRHG